MENLRLKKKILLTLIALVCALCASICIFFGINASSANGGTLEGDAANSFGTLNSAGGNDGADFTYTYGQSYTIGGTNYTLGDGEKEYIDYKTALGLGDGYTVTLKSFTYPDGTVGTSEIGGVRNAGSYVFEVNGPARANQVVTLDVNPQQIDYSSVDKIPVFVNATAPTYKAHGDITAIYKHNDGWYPSQKSGEVPVEIRTITNAYYYETGNVITIRMANEVLDGGSYTATTSTLKYDDSITINITDRVGIQYKDSNEYIATFKFNVPNSNYVFTYGNAGVDDEITDKNKGINITQRTSTSFVLSKHWFIAKYASLFVATDDTANYPFVPFHDNDKIEAAGGVTNISGSKVEGENGETNTAADTVTYTDAFTVKTPVAKFNSGLYDANDKEIIKDGTVKFDVIYVDLDGKTHRVATQVALDATGGVAQNTLSYYFNKTMPAGNYTLKLYGEIAQSEMAAGHPNKIQGEYWLTVLPKTIDATLIGNLHGVIRGELDSLADDTASGINKYINSYALGSGKLHESLSDEIADLNDSLNTPLRAADIESYWNDLSAAAKAEYYDSVVTIKYNREGWGITNYVSEAEIKQMLTQVGTYTLYYSVSAKNYVTVGGANDANRTDYGFRTRLSTGISIKEIYNMIVNADNPYFKNAVYTGGQAHTLVPYSANYTYSFDDDDYTDVRDGATVTLTLLQPDCITSWENDLPDGVDFDAYFELSDDSQELTVYFDIVPATNTWTVAPQMSPWAYGGFNKDANFITAAIAFTGADTYYRIGIKQEDGTYAWQSVNGTIEIDGVIHPEYFAVGADGKIVDEDGSVTEMLNGLGAGTYALNGYITAIENVNARQMRDEGSSNVFVVKAANSWVDTPVMTGWTYKNFNADSCFFAGKAAFGGDNVTYSLYDGRTASGTARKTFKTLDDIVDGEKIADTLKNLNAGTYTLVASLGGTDDYSSLSQTITLDVTPATNAWQNAPIIGNWTYDEFDDDLFIGGNANHGNVVYTVQHVDETGNPADNVDDDKVQISEEALLEMLGTLGAGRYNLLAEALATANYGVATQSVRFSVNKAYNAWVNDNPPTVSGWVFGEYNATTNAPTAAQAVHNTDITYTYQYFPAIRISGIWTANGEEISQSDIATAEAGDYIMIVTADGNVNYNALVHTVNFVISKQSNSWTNEPSDRFDWDLENANTIDSSALVNAAATEQTNGITYKIENIAATGTAQTITVKNAADKASLIAALKALPVGDYRITVTVEESDNYGLLQKVTTSTVSRTENNWNVELNGGTWTWGASAAALALLNKPNADYGNDTMVFTVKNGTSTIHTIRVADEDSLDAAFDALKTYLGGLSVGTYTVTVSIAPTATYAAPPSVTAEYTVGIVTTAWDDTTAANNNKEYNWVLLGDNETVTQPVLGTPAWGKTAEYKLLKGEQELYNGSTWSSLISALNDCKAGEYTIYAHIDGDTNHTALDYSVTVNISIAENEWNTELNGGAWTWGASATTIDALSKPNADYGNDTIVFTVKNGATTMQTIRAVDNDMDTAFDALKSYLAGLNAGTYSVTVSIAATNDYAAPQPVTVQYTVNKVTTVWNAATTANNNKEYNWVLLGEKEEITQPVIGTPAAQLGTWGSAVNYKLAKGEQELYNGSTWSSLISALNNCKAGEYAVTAHIDGDTNHTALDYSITVIISVTANFWTEKIGNGDSTAVEVSCMYGADMSNIKFTPAYGDVVITVNGKETDDFVDYINRSGIGEYLIVATVDATDEYGALIDTVRLVITKADNSWSSNLSIAASWTWHNVAQNIRTNLVLPVSAQGDSALVTVTSDGSIAVEATISYIRDNGVRKVNQNDYDALVLKLCALNVGSYTITVTVAEADNYAALNGEKAQVKAFNITQATNGWATNGEPSISGWSFGGDTAYPTATPVFGKNTVVFSYAEQSDSDKVIDGKRYPADDAVWQSAPSYTAGSYWLRAVVPATNNYSELVGYHPFVVGAAKNDWVNHPSVIAWNWNGYDRLVNLFSGSARSNQPAKFSIAAADGTDLTLDDFNAVDGTGIDQAALNKLKAIYLVKIDDLSEKPTVVSSDIAQLLNALKNGSYLLTVYVDGGESLDPISGSTTFTVGKAENGWATDEQTGRLLAPSVRYYGYGESDVFTAGQALYGTTISYRIDNGEVITDTAVLVAKLKALNVGSYVLSAWVEAKSSDTFKSLYSSSNPYSVTFTVSRVANSWQTSPKTSVSEYYAVIHGSGFDIAAWLGKPVPTNGTEGYTIMSVDYSQSNANPYTYAEFVTAVGNLPAGEYIVRVSVPAESTNYLALTQDMALTISKYGSKFTGLPQKLTGKWQQGANKENATVLDDVDIKAFSYITDGETDTNVAELTVKYILNGKTNDSFADLKTAVASLSRGSYQVTVFVTQTDSYEGLSAILQLDIAAGDNTWITGGNAPAPEQTLIVKGDEDKQAVTQWAWSTEIDWLGVKPLYGDTVVIRIVSQSDESNVLKYFTVHSGEGFDTQRELVSTYISKLDKGAYIMIITAPSGDNWNGIDDVTATSDTSALQNENAPSTRIMFEIVTAVNAWKSEDLAPHFSGNDVTLEGGVYKWMYGTTVTPQAEARFGTTRVAYYTADGAALTGMPTSAGTYKAVFSVAKPATDNYTAIDGNNAVTLTFTIEGVVYEAFDVSLNASGWVWNSYDSTVNLFRGKPTSGGKIHFEVLSADGTVIAEKFDLVDADGKHHNNYDKDIYVPATVASKLKALTKGTYTLRAYVDANNNYEAFDAETTFDVTEAINTWVTTPRIASWFRGGYLESKNAPVAVSLYGAPVVVITSNASGETLYRAVYDEEAGEYNVLVDLLEPADAGWYTMSVSVDGLTGKYTSLPTADVEFQIFIQGSPDDKNFWEVTPGIEGWTATIDGKVTMPTGKPVRGKPYFVFYKAELDGDDYKLVEKVVAGVDALTVKKGENYAQDFYIPMAPGTYFMYAYALNAAVPSDALDEDDSSRVMLVIRNRANSWEKSVSIQSMLYLGERESWADPTAKASLANSDISYKYLDAATRKDLGTEIPASVGKYVVVAYASNRYSQTIESEMEFQVLLSKNYWVGDTSPTIADWSEESSAKSPKPVGEAMFGTIEYTYVNKANPKKELKEKPTVAGDYIMIARVELDGYETLEARYSFTIGPAFDSTLITINIILGVIACIIASVVIYFAIKRNKEN